MTWTWWINDKAIMKKHSKAKQPTPAKKKWMKWKNTVKRWHEHSIIYIYIIYIVGYSMYIMHKHWFGMAWHMVLGSTYSRWQIFSWSLLVCCIISVYICIICVIQQCSNHPVACSGDPISPGLRVGTCWNLETNLKKPLDSPYLRVVSGCLRWHSQSH
jgi:hypothetical protein